MNNKYTLELNYNQMSIIYCALSEYEETQSHIDTNRFEAKTVSVIKKEIETVKELKSEILKITGRKETPKEKQYRLYTWEEREQLRGRWIRKKEAFGEEECIKELHISNIGTLLINLKHASEIFEFWEFLDGSPCGVPVEDGEELVQRRQDCIAKFSKE